MYSDYCQWWFGQCQGADTYLKKPKMAFSLLKLLVHCPDITCAVGLTTGNFGLDLHLNLSLYCPCCLLDVESEASELLDVLDVSPGRHPQHPPSYHRRREKNTWNTRYKYCRFLFLRNMFHTSVPARRLDQVETYLKHSKTRMQDQILLLYKLHITYI